MSLPTSRQQRRARREAERKAKKAEYRREKEAQFAPPSADSETHAAHLDESPCANPSPFPTDLPTNATTAEPPSHSAQNARTHGMCSNMLILPDENPTEYDLLLGNFLREYRPADTTECILVNEMIEHYWRLRRIRNREAEILEQGAEFDDDRLKLCHRYATSHDRAYHRALRTLRQIQAERKAETSTSAAQSSSFGKSGSSEQSSSFGKSGSFGKNPPDSPRTPEFVSQKAGCNNGNIPFEPPQSGAELSTPPVPHSQSAQAA